MFKSVKDRVWAFDAEWVPDPQTGRAVYGLDAELADEEVVAHMWQRGGATENEPRPYLKTILCQVVSISVLARYVEVRGRHHRAARSALVMALSIDDVDILTRILWARLLTLTASRSRARRAWRGVARLDGKREFSLEIRDALDRLGSA